MNVSKLSVVFLAVAAIASSCSQSPTPNVANTTANANRPPAATPAPAATPVSEIAVAKEIYATNCMICHKDTGKGGKITLEGKTINPDDLTAEKFKKMTDEKLIGYVTNGVEDEGMPAFKDKLTADQIKSAIGHVRTLQN